MKFLRFFLRLLCKAENKRHRIVNRVSNMFIHDELEGYRRIFRSMEYKEG